MMLTDEQVRCIAEQAAEDANVLDTMVGGITVRALALDDLQLRAERVAWESTGDAALRDLAEIQVENERVREELAEARTNDRVLLTTVLEMSKCAKCGKPESKHVLGYCFQGIDRPPLSRVNDRFRPAEPRAKDVTVIGHVWSIAEGVRFCKNCASTFNTWKVGEPCPAMNAPTEAQPPVECDHLDIDLFGSGDDITGECADCGKKFVVLSADVVARMRATLEMAEDRLVDAGRTGASRRCCEARALLPKEGERDAS